MNILIMITMSIIMGPRTSRPGEILVTRTIKLLRKSGAGRAAARAHARARGEGVPSLFVLRRVEDTQLLAFDLEMSNRCVVLRLNSVRPFILDACNTSQNRKRDNPGQIPIDIQPSLSTLR